MDEKSSSYILRWRYSTHSLTRWKSWHGGALLVSPLSFVNELWIFFIYFESLHRKHAPPRAFEGWAIGHALFGQWVTSNESRVTSFWLERNCRKTCISLFAYDGSLYILSCSWTSPDPDALFICYLKIRSYLARHCLPPDTRGTGYLAKREAGIYHPVPALTIQQCATHRYLGPTQRCYACCLSFSSLPFLLPLLSPRSW